MSSRTSSNDSGTTDAKRSLRTNIYIGIDPGLGGAIALIVNGTACVFDTPTATDGVKRRYLLGSMRDILAQGDSPKHACIEAVHAMKGQGVTSMFSFGEGYGIWKGLLSGLGIPFETVTPQRWQKELMDGRPKTKGASRIRAQELFPYLSHTLQRIKDDGRADALLIAEYGRRIFP
jgi:crossover junction endodeoxyribonuclease RuvC